MQLRIQSADGRSQSITLDPAKPLRVGSHPSAEVVATGANIQKVHCGITFKEGSYRIILNKDCAPIEVNGQPSKGAILRDGDRIRVGETVLIFGDSPATSAQPNIEDEFGLAPLDDGPKAAAPKPVEDEYGLTPLDDGPKSSPMAAKPAQPTAVKPAAGAGPAAKAGPAAVKPSTASSGGKGKPADDPFGLGGSAAADDPFGLSPTTGGGSDDPFGLGTPAGSAPAASDPFAAPAGSGSKSARGGSGGKGAAPTAGGGLGPELPSLGELPSLPSTSAGLPSMPLTSGGKPGVGGKPTAGAKPKVAAGPAGPSIGSRIAAWSKTSSAQSLFGILAMFAAVGLGAWLVSRLPTPEMAYAEADRLYAAKDYERASAAFTDYAQKYPTHRLVDIARIKSGLARLYPQYAAGRDWKVVMVETKSVLDDWGPLAQSSLAQQSLSDLLPKLAAAMVARAQGATDDPKGGGELLKEAQAGLGLAMRHLPTDVQVKKGLAPLEIKLVGIERDVRQASALSALVDRIKTARDGGKFAETFALRDEVILEFPTLAGAPSLIQVMSEVAAAEAAQVRGQPGEKPAPVKEPVGAAKTWFSTPWGSWPQIMLPSGPGKQPDSSPPPDATPKPGPIIAIASAHFGIVVGFDVGMQEPVWQHYLGAGVTAEPVAVGEGASAGVIVVDARLSTLVRLKLTTGKPTWTLPLGDTSGQPILAQDRVVVVERGGLVREIDLAQGTELARYQFALPLLPTATFDAARGVYYVLAEHSNLYVVSPEKSACIEGHALGHPAGSITLPPVVFGERLVIVEADGLAESKLHLFAAKPQLKRLQTEKIAARIATGPLVVEDQIWLACDNGEVLRYSLKGGSTERPLEAGPRIAAPFASLDEATPRQVLVSGQGWLFGDGVRVFDPKSPTADVATSSAASQSSFAIEGRPVIVGDVAICVGRGLTSGVRWVLGMSNRGELREVHPLAVPIVAMAARGDDAAQGVVALDAYGCLYDWNAKSPAKASSKSQVPRAMTRVLAAPAAAARLPDGTIVFLPGRGATMLFAVPGKPAAEGDAPSPLIVTQLPGPLACAPVVVQDLIAVAIQDGPLCLVDPRSGQVVGEPFFPEVAAGTGIDWSGLGAVGTNQLAAARRPAGTSPGMLWLFQLTGSPPRLVIAAEVATQTTLDSPLAAIKTHLFAIDTHAALVSYEIAKEGNNTLLKAGPARPFVGGFEVGPLSIDGRVVIGTGSGQIVVVADADGPLFSTPVQSAALIALTPLGGDRYAAVFADGSVGTFELPAGQPPVGPGKLIRTGLPLSGPIVKNGNEWLAAGRDGVLYALPVSEESSR